MDWRDANLRSAPDKKALQLFRCTDEVLKTRVDATGAHLEHSAIWEWRAQEIIQNTIRSATKPRWVVRVGCDSGGVGAVMASEEIDRNEHFHLTVGALATRLRGQHRGALGVEMVEDMFGALVLRCIEQGHPGGEVLLTGTIHRLNRNSQRMCTDRGFECVGATSDSDDHEEWERRLLIPQPSLIGDFPT